MATFLLVVTWCALSAYAVFAGADFGAGCWDLVAGRGADRDAARRRDLVEHVIGPVWEANHVWLIFVLVLLWTSFPPVFAAVASTLYIPLTLVALGIIGRGAAFAFRKAAVGASLPARRAFGATFAASSVLTPFFLGAVGGAIAAGRVPPGIAAGDVLRSWLAPLPLLAGALAVVACAFLAAAYLTGDAVRTGDAGLAHWFRRRAVGAGVLTGALALAGLAVTRATVPALWDGLTGRGAPFVGLSAAAGLTALGLLGTGRAIRSGARVAAALAVAAVLWGWGVAAYPTLLPGLSIMDAAAASGALRATAVVVVAGSGLLVPAMLLLYRLFSEPQGAPDG